MADETTTNGLWIKSAGDRETLGIGKMKIQVDVDCTPEEARIFFGLPDVKPMHDAMMAEIEERLKADLATADPEALARMWLPAGIEGFEQLQKMFWSHRGGGKGKED